LIALATSGLRHPFGIFSRTLPASLGGSGKDWDEKHPLTKGALLFMTSPLHHDDADVRIRPTTLDDAGHLANFDTKLQLIRDRVRGVADKYQTACYLVGRPGVSKTFTVKQTLDSLGVPWVARNARMTPMGLFDLIADHPEHVLLLDDIGTLFKQDQAMQIMMAALDGSPQEARLVTYKSKDRDEKVLFTGGMVAISNAPLRHDPLANALRSRAVILEHEPSDDEVAAFLRSLASKGHKGLTPAECHEVVEFLVAETRELDQRLDLRHWEKAVEDYRQDTDGNSRTRGWELGRSSLLKLAELPVPHFSKKQEIELQRRRVQDVIAKYPNDPAKQMAELGLKKSTFYQRRREVMTAA
jgi:hypothetical protein